MTSRGLSVKTHQQLGGSRACYEITEIDTYRMGTLLETVRGIYTKYAALLPAAGAS
jgi:hypothetical protein